MAQDCRTCRPVRLHIGWRAGTTTLCHSRLFPPARDYEFGYYSQLSLFDYMVLVPARQATRPVTLTLRPNSQSLTGGNIIQLTIWHMVVRCRTGPSGYIGWRAGTTTLCHSRLYSPVRDYQFGYCSQLPLCDCMTVRNVDKREERKFRITYGPV